MVETATQIAGVRLLAVDLSTASLAFAKRKADEYGLPDIRFAQADILCLGTLNQRFDFIDSTGVLHHMQDPSAGLSVLAGLLKDDGVMRLALYSETARNAVVAVRQKIAETKASDDPESIRQLRQQLMNLPKNAAERAVVQFADFYSLSECRDLLFPCPGKPLLAPRNCSPARWCRTALHQFRAGPIAAGEIPGSLPRRTIACRPRPLERIRAPKSRFLRFDVSILGL